MNYDDGLYFEQLVGEYTRSPESIMAVASVSRQSSTARALGRIALSRSWQPTIDRSEKVIAFRDNAIVDYAETKVRKKSDRDVWVLAGEILGSLS